MKKIHIMGWLVMAAAFITTFTACSSDDAIEEPKAPVRSISVTVGAGIINPATTRSFVDYNEDTKERTLKFTTGDKLFVRVMYGEFVEDGENIKYYDHILSGLLTMVGSPTNEDKSASFSGTLEQYDRGSVNSTGGYDYTPAGSISFPLPSDPIGGAQQAYATLVHSSATLNTDYTDEGWDIYYNPFKLAPDVNTLMTKNLAVTSSSDGKGYNSSTKSFRLYDIANSPIINCTISGLTDGTTYTVTYDADGTDYDVTFDDEVTAHYDNNYDSGVVTFAFFGEELSDNHALKFVSSSPSETKTAILGKKVLAGGKIYNTSRTAN